MESKPPPVPSKNALRALRWLAFSSPTLLAGAIGSACGIATLECEARRRIHLAERIINTKQTIRSVSNGRSASHLAQMFEAAERGEDFTLDPAKSHKRRRVRNYSALAVQQEQNSEEMEILQQWMQDRNQNIALTPIYQDRQHQRSKESRRVHLEDGRQVRDTAARQSHSQQMINDLIRGIQDGNQVVAETPQKLSVPMKTQEDHTKDHLKSNGWINLSDSRTLEHQTTRKFDLSNVERLGSQQTSWIDLSNPGPSIPRMIHHADPSATKSTRQQWEPFKLAKSALEAEPSHLQVAGVENLTMSSFDQITDHTVEAQQEKSSAREHTRRFVDLNQLLPGSKPRLTFVLPPSLVFETSDITYRMENDTQDRTPNTYQASKTQKGKAARAERLVLNIVSYGDQVPENLPDIVIGPDIDLFKSSLLRYASPDLLKSIMDSLNLIEDAKLRRPAWEKHMSELVNSGTESDLATAELLYHEYFPTFTRNASPEPARILAERLLSATPLSDRAAAILFPYLLQPAKAVSGKALHQSAHHYLSTFNQRNPDPNKQVTEVHKVLSLAVWKGVELSEYLVEPTIRSLCSLGETDLAEKLLKEVESKYGVEWTFFTLTPLVHGLANSDRWSNIDQIMLGLHEAKVSKRRPIGYTLLFSKAFQYYLEKKPMDEALRYLNRAVEEWKITPNSAVSASLIIACLKSGRYDVVQEWVQYLRTRFPRMESTSNTFAIAWQIGRMWQEMDSSCEEIEKACQAIAFCATKDMFSNAFRGIASEAIRRHLSYKIRIIRENLSQDETAAGVKIDDTTSLPHLFQYAYDIISSCSSSRNLLPEQQALLEDFSRQIKAVNDLDRLFGGEDAKPKFDEAFIFEQTQKISRRREEKVVSRTISDSLPETLMREVLPPWTELLSLVETFYSSRATRGLSTSHDILRYLVPKLVSHHREYQAALLLDTIHQSCYVQGQDGTPFDAELYSDWLKVAYDLKSTTQITKILWAVVDSGSSIQLTSLFLLLARTAALKAPTFAQPQYRHGISGTQPAQSVAEELDYLQKRLKKRSWIKYGRPDNPVKFSLYNTWEERMRDMSAVEATQGETYEY